MDERITRAKAIRLKCLDCCCNQPAEVRRCDIKQCPCGVLEWEQRKRIFCITRHIKKKFKR